jgi:hypothetical protein
VKFTPTTASYSLILKANYGGDSNDPATAGAYSLLVAMKAIAQINVRVREMFFSFIL